MKLLLTLITALTLNAAGFWTLTGVEKANIYVQNQLSIVKPKTIEKIKEKMAKMLENNAIATNQQDSPTLMCSLEELVGDETYYIHIKLALGEEVLTFREQKAATFALTFEATDFIETDAESMEADILESVDFLLSQFSDLHQDDNE
ncbi:MAG: hypothetical protein JXQ67_11530 [Campylobacterales bacterium]|nr:hypothetical protein [Campylobacterales bacterium]